MPHSSLDRYRAKPLLDIASFARRGPGQQRSLLPEEVARIARTVRSTPEVMVKVLSHGGQDLGAVRRHFDYLSRKGELDIETDDGQHLSGKNSEKTLVSDWDLELEVTRRSANLEARPRRRPPKLTHKILFSMPAGTPPEKVLGAVREFCREEFGLRHRYALVLHTDEPHPHVHVVVKAMGEDGHRLNIRKATLREWRSAFARKLRERGVAANATERAMRGVTKPQKSDGIYRAMRAGRSTHMRTRAESVAAALHAGDLQVEAGKSRMLDTRREVIRQWSGVQQSLRAGGRAELADEVERFVGSMPPPQTEREWMAQALTEKTRGLGRGAAGRQQGDA